MSSHHGTMSKRRNQLGEKPHLCMTKYGGAWRCFNAGASAIATTPREAYLCWLKAYKAWKYKQTSKISGPVWYR